DKGISWGTLRKKFGDETADPALLSDLSKEGYTATKNEKGEWVHPDEFGVVGDDFRSFTTSKANQIIERECFDFWKWIIPTLISVAALVISALALL
ncbi:MAG: hypothetical protein ACI4JN_01510, partial [Ruminococcus sp.]